MKKLVLFFVSLSTWGCQRVFQVSDYNESTDEFRNVNRYTFEESLTPFEKRPAIGNVRNLYLNEVHTSGESAISLYVILIKNQPDFYTEDVFYLKVDDQIFEKKVDVQEVEHYSTFSESTSNVLKADSTTVSVVDSYSQIKRVQSRFKIEFTNQEIAAILKADDMRYRYYSGGKTSTFVLTNGNLRKLKQVLSQR